MKDTLSFQPSPIKSENPAKSALNRLEIVRQRPFTSFGIQPQAGHLAGHDIDISVQEEVACPVAIPTTQIQSANPREKAYRLHDGRGLCLEVSPRGGTWWRFTAASARTPPIPGIPCVRGVALGCLARTSFANASSGLASSHRRMVTAKPVSVAPTDGFPALGSWCTLEQAPPRDQIARVRSDDQTLQGRARTVWRTPSPDILRPMRRGDAVSCHGVRDAWAGSRSMGRQR